MADDDDRNARIQDARIDKLTQKIRVQRRFLGRLQGDIEILEAEIAEGVDQGTVIHRDDGTVVQDKPKQLEELRAKHLAVTEDVENHERILASWKGGAMTKSATKV